MKSGPPHNASTRLKKLLIKNGMAVYPDPWHALRDSRINEVAKLSGVTDAQLDLWFGNSASVRRRHYSAMAVTNSDKANVLVKSQFSKNPQPVEENPQIVRSISVQGGSQEAVEKEDLLETLMKLGINDVSELKKYIRRDSNPQPSVPKTDALSS